MTSSSSGVSSTDTSDFSSSSRGSRKADQFRGNYENFLTTDPTDMCVVTDLECGAGAGLFADKDFDMGAFLLVYRGTHALEVDDPHPDRHMFKFTYTTGAGEDWIVDAENENAGIARMINDCDPYHKPNAVAKQKEKKSPDGRTTIAVNIVLSAIRPIKKGTYL
jgi:hypothetical protein